MRKPFVGGNWKTKIPKKREAEILAETIGASGYPANVEVAIFPQDSHLYRVGELVLGGGKGLGSQNISKGIDPSTGELPIETLLDAGGRYALIGHSEQRQYYGETDRDVNDRLIQVLKHNLEAKDPADCVVPIVCVGENLKERKSGQTDSIIVTQLVNGLNTWALSNHVSDYLAALGTWLIIAYEPVWAIGTGETATPEEAEEVHAYIRWHLEKWNAEYGPAPSDWKAKALANNTRLIYGGSVKPDNAKKLIAQPNIDGFLVGGASLDAESFSAIIEAAAGE